jgi:hypothetical protein
VCRERKRGSGSLSGQGTVLLGPGRDQRPQGSVGGEDAVVAVAVDVVQREDGGETIQELESREAQRGPTGRVWLREDVEDLIGVATDQMESDIIPCLRGELETLRARIVGGSLVEKGPRATCLRLEDLVTRIDRILDPGD